MEMEMTPLEKQIAIAKEDGWEFTKTGEPFKRHGGVPFYNIEGVATVPKYFDSHDALLPVLAKMSEEEWEKFSMWTFELVTNGYKEQEGSDIVLHTEWLLTQYPSVLADIYLKVKGYEI